MPHSNQPIHIFEKFWPSWDLNQGPSTFATDALTTELLDWADWRMSNLRWHDGSRPYDLQLPSLSLLTGNTQLLPGRARWAWVNDIRFHTGFKHPSKNTINTRLAGMQLGHLAWHIVLLQSETRSYHHFDTVHFPTMPHANQPMPHLEKCWPSRDSNTGLSTFTCTIALTLWIVPRCHTSINQCHTLKSYDPSGIWTQDLPLLWRML